MITYTKNVTDGCQGSVIIAKGTTQFENATLTDVIETYTGHDSTDRYCEVWDAETQSVRQIEIGHGYCTTTMDWATVRPDATEEVIELAKAWEEKQAQIRREQQETEARNRERLIVRQGQRVQVVKGRTNPRHIQGQVFWVGLHNEYDRVGFRVGFKTDEGVTHWDYMRNVAVV